jgi:PDZ domain-containing secreted protein
MYIMALSSSLCYIIGLKEDNMGKNKKKVIKVIEEVVTELKIVPIRTKEELEAYFLSLGI